MTPCACALVSHSDLPTYLRPTYTIEPQGRPSVPEATQTTDGSAKDTVPVAVCVGLALDLKTRAAYERVASTLFRYVTLAPWADVARIIDGYGQTEFEGIETQTAISGRGFILSNVVRIYEASVEDVNSALNGSHLGVWAVEPRSGILVAGFDSRENAEAAMFLLRQANLPALLNPACKRCAGVRWRVAQPCRSRVGCSLPLSYFVWSARVGCRAQGAEMEERRRGNTGRVRAERGARP